MFFFPLIKSMLAMKEVVVMTAAMAVRLAGWCYLLILDEKSLLSNTPTFASTFFMILILAAWVVLGCTMVWFIRTPTLSVLE